MKRFFAVAFACLSLSCPLSEAAAGSPTQPTPSPQVAKLIRDLQEQSNPIARVAALKNLALLGSAAAPAVPSIIDAINENRAGMQTGMGIGKPISPAITDNALIALAKIGLAAHDAAPYLTPLLKDRNELLRRPLVLGTLNVIGPSSEAGAVLLQVVGEEGKLTPTRAVAIQVLGKVEPPVVEACDLLREIAADGSDVKSQKAAQVALDSIVSRADHQARFASENGEDSSLTMLRSQLDSKLPEETRVSALEQITELGPKAKTLVPTLMSLAGERNLSVRHGALNAIAAIGPAASVSIPGLISRFLGEANKSERKYYCDAITRIDPSGKRTMPLLQESLEDPFKARLAIEILNELGTDQTTSVAQKARVRWKIRD